MPDTCIHGRRVSQSCPGCGNAPAAERVRASLVYRVTIPGNPGAAAVNARAKPIVRKGAKHPEMILTDGYRGWRDLAIPLMRRAAAAHPAQGFMASLRAGAITIEVNAYWPRQHQQGEAEGLALGDVDAAIKACLDALRKPVPPKPPEPGKKRGTPGKPGAHIITDDAQAKRAVLEKHIDAREPRIEIEVRRAP